MIVSRLSNWKISDVDANDGVGAFISNIWMLSGLVYSMMNICYGKSHMVTKIPSQSITRGSLVCSVILYGISLGR